MTSIALTSDFHQAFERQTTRLLRGRFLWFTGIFALVSAVWLAGSIGMFFVWRGTINDATRWAYLVRFGQHGLDVLLYGLVFLQVWKRPISDERLVKMSVAIIVFDGFASLLLDVASGQWGPGSVWSLLLPHMLATLFLPWRLSQAIWPVLPVLALHALVTLLSGVIPGTPELGWGLKALLILVSLLMPLPGVLIAALKHDSRVKSFKMQFLENKYGQVRRELADARRIHESLFPRAEARGTVRFDYRYQPMRLIGGDYLYARFHEADNRDDPALTLLLMDVTGHGVAAALTVNRLYGEVERLFGENPAIRPGEVVRALNRYVYHTLANHALYVTAVCVRIDPTSDAAEYASAGHPPAFLRGVDGTIDQLDSTTFLLGAVKDDEFDASTAKRPFVRGDTMVLYTDGAMEAADKNGRQLGIAGLQRAIASCAGLAPGEWSANLLTSVDRHREGPPADDTLVVEINRLIVPAPGLGPGEQRVAVVY